MAVADEALPSRVDCFSASSREGFLPRACCRSRQREPAASCRPPHAAQVRAPLRNTAHSPDLTSAKQIIHAAVLLPRRASCAEPGPTHASSAGSLCTQWAKQWATDRLPRLPAGRVQASADREKLERSFTMPATMGEGEKNVLGTKLEAGAHPLLPRRTLPVGPKPCDIKSLLPVRRRRCPQVCSLAPKTGFYRDGYCCTGPSDTGRHVVCCRVRARPCPSPARAPWRSPCCALLKTRRP